MSFTGKIKVIAENKKGSARSPSEITTWKGGFFYCGGDDETRGSTLHLRKVTVREDAPLSGWRAWQVRIPDMEK
jgi:hypothetical protein